MEFDWTTFALEVLNFLVLVWLLKRFFYRPVLAVIEARRAANAKTIADAEAVRGEARSIEKRIPGAPGGSGQGTAAAKARLDEDIAAERARRLAALEAEIGEERRRREALEARERSERELALERKAMAIAARFAARLLERLAGPELEAKLVELALSELDAQPPDKLEALRTALREPGVKHQGGQRLSARRGAPCRLHPDAQRAGGPRTGAQVQRRRRAQGRCVHHGRVVGADGQPAR